MSKVHEILRRLFDRVLLRFALVGVINTLVGTAIMLFCYNVLRLNCWSSSALNYFLASVLSFLLNKNYTFHYGKTDRKSVIRFILNIIACYILAYGLAKPLARWTLAGFEQVIQENVAMIVGTVLFIVINLFRSTLLRFQGKMTG